MLAYDYPILGLFWSMLIFFLWIAWIMLVFRVITDIFRNHEMRGISKALWLIFVIIVPWFGVLIYLLANGNDMASRSIAEQQAAQDQFDSYVRQTAGASVGSADEITKLAGLRDSGEITAEEFAAQKAKLLA
jgi:hypothetical protein